MLLEEDHDGRCQMRDSSCVRRELGFAAPDGWVPLAAGTRRGLTCRIGGSRYDWREPAALLHREGEPRPSPSMQHNSDDGRGARPATEGSRGSAAPEGEPSPMLRKQRDVTDGGTLTASEGSLRLCCTGGESPPCDLMQGAV